MDEFVTESYDAIMKKVEAYNFCNRVDKLRRSLDDALVAFEKETENDKNRFCEDAKEVIEKGVEYLKYLTRKSWASTYLRDETKNEEEKDDESVQV